MDIKKTQFEIGQRRLELKHQIEEISLQQSQLEQLKTTAKRELRGLDQMYAGTEIAIGSPDGHTPSAPGLTEYIRDVLANTQVALTARQVRDLCEAAEIKAASRKNLLISVHTILKRLDLYLKKVRLDGQLAYLPRPTLKSIPRRQMKR